MSTIKETGNIDIFLRIGFNITSEEISEKFEGNQGNRVTIVNMEKNA